MSLLFNGVYLDREGTADSLNRLIQQALSEGAQGLLILSADENPISKEEYNHILGQLDLPVAGGIFPRIIFQDECLAVGHLVCALDVEPEILLCESLSSNIHSIDQLLSKRFRDASNKNNYLLFLDGLSPAIDYVVERTYYHLGSEATVIGGGSGSASLKKNPCIFTNDGLREDAALFISVSANLKINLSSGWQKALGPYLVTSAEGNVIHTLNYQPAFDVYRDAIASITQHVVSAEDFCNYAIDFPIGMESGDGEAIIRDPIQVNGSSLLCVGSVPQYSMVHIMKATTKELIDSVTHMAQNISSNNHSQYVIVFDCVSRMFCLRDRFTQEISSIKNSVNANAQVIGALTLGEIASSPNGSIQLHNKATVVGTSEGVSL